MYVEIVATANNNLTLGDQVSTGNRDYQVGTCNIELYGTQNTENPTITVYGKLIQSDDESVDSGWVELASWTPTAQSDASGFPIDILPSMSCSITGNATDTKNVQVTIGHTELR